jgi:hypothetical protein
MTLIIALPVLTGFFIAGLPTTANESRVETVIAIFFAWLGSF